MSHAYFHRQGDLLVPDRTVRSPWNPNHQSGLAIAGQLIRAVEAAPAARPMRLARVTIDFLGAVLMRPTEARMEILRDDGGAQAIQASLWVEGEMSASATAIRVRADGEAPPVGPPLDFPGPEESPREGVTPYFGVGHPLETRVIRRGSPDGTPGVFWSRFNTSYVAGEATSAAIRVCMAADIASGAASTSALRGWRIPNADLSLYFTREPQGDWLLAVSAIDIGGEGVAMTRSTLADHLGVFGFSRQTLMLSRARPAA